MILFKILNFIFGVTEKNCIMFWAFATAFEIPAELYLN